LRIARFLVKNVGWNAPDLILKRRFFSEQSVTKRGILLTLCFLVGSTLAKFKDNQDNKGQLYFGILANLPK
jgi:hypothetical protein